MKLNEFKQGDIILMTTRTKRSTEVRSAIVSSVNYNGNGEIGFTDYYDKVDGANGLSSGSGSFDPERLGAKPFGLIAVKIVGHKKHYGLASFRGPRPGDRGYDLMC